MGEGGLKVIPACGATDDVLGPKVHRSWSAVPQGYDLWPSTVGLLFVPTPPIATIAGVVVIIIGAVMKNAED